MGDDPLRITSTLWRSAMMAMWAVDWRLQRHTNRDLNSTEKRHSVLLNLSLAARSVESRFSSQSAMGVPDFEDGDASQNDELPKNRNMGKPHVVDHRS